MSSLTGAEELSRKLRGGSCLEVAQAVNPSCLLLMLYTGNVWRAKELSDGNKKQSDCGNMSEEEDLSGKVRSAFQKANQENFGTQ